MTRIIEIDERFSPIGILRSMRKNEEAMIPYDDKRMSAIKFAAAKMNKEYRLANRKSTINLMYRVSKTANEGYITVKRMI